jgi:flagellar M-ring protein FliF
MISSLQQQFLSFWNKQQKSQRIILISLVAAAAILTPVLIAWANTPSYVVAYSDLSESDAGQIVQKLEESGIAYKLKNSTTILVPSDKVYEARLQMARDGLPKSSTVGYELFSGNTLGMTEFTQQINYQRALEGELERTIGSLESVDTVRVHVVIPEKTLLSSDQSPATASITIKVKPGQSLDRTQVRAITHLVASSVEGLKPENVVLVDSEGNMLASGSPDDQDAATSQTDSQRVAESSAADEIKRRVQNMLDQVLGPNQSTVQASVAMDWTQRETTSNTYDPTPAAVRSSQKVNEAYNTNGQALGGIPGASSNLPTPVPTVTGMPNGTIYSRSEETLNYEISQVQSKEVVTPGQVKRVSVSVMVDSVKDAAQLATLKSAVIAAAGIDEARGDQVVVESLAFDRTYSEQQSADLAKQQQTDLYMRYGMIGAAALFVIIMLVIFQRFISGMRKASREAWRPILMPVREMALDAGAAGSAGALGAGSVAHAALPQQQQFEALSSALPQGAPASAKKMDEDVVVELSRRTQEREEDEQRSKIITRLSEESPATVAEIIQVWLSEDEKRNGRD